MNGRDGGQVDLLINWFLLNSDRFIDNFQWIPFCVVVT